MKKGIPHRCAQLLWYRLVKLTTKNIHHHRDVVCVCVCVFILDRSP